MTRKYSSLPPVAAALTIPLLLWLPHTLVAAFSIHDYIPSALGSPRFSGGGSALVRRADVPEAGYYNPLDYGGYMMTVSFSPLHFLPPLLVGRPWCPFLDTAILLSGTTSDG